MAHLTVMRLPCPWCGTEVDAYGWPGALVPDHHSPSRSVQGMCVASGFSREEAQAFARIRDEAGGERFLTAAHP